MPYCGPSVATTSSRPLSRNCPAPASSPAVKNTRTFCSNNRLHTYNGVARNLSSEGPKFKTEGKARGNGCPEPPPYKLRGLGECLSSPAGFGAKPGPQMHLGRIKSLLAANVVKKINNFQAVGETWLLKLRGVPPATTVYIQYSTRRLKMRDLEIVRLWKWRTKLQNWKMQDQIIVVHHFQVLKFQHPLFNHTRGMRSQNWCRIQNMNGSWKSKHIS